MRGFWAGLVAALLVRKLTSRSLLVMVTIAFLSALYTIDLLLFAARAVSLSAVLAAVLVGTIIWAIRKIRVHDRQYQGRHRKGWAR